MNCVHAGNGCPDSVQIFGDNVICPGEYGVFKCIVTNSRGTNWNVNGTQFGWLAGTEVARRVISRPGIHAVLMERNVGANDIGNRTSLLHYTPSPSRTGTVASIACDGGRANACEMTSWVVGKYVWYTICFS